MVNFGQHKSLVNNMDSKEGLEALFEFATEGILVSDDKGVIIKTNPATERMFGYGRGELLGKKVEVLVPYRHAPKHEQYRDKYNQNPHARSMGATLELYAKRKDGSEFPVEISLSPFKATDGHFVIAFIIDITIRKKAEDAVLRQKAELEKLNADLEKRVKERTLVLEEAISELNQTKEDLNEALQKEKELNDLKSRFVSMASHEFRTPLATILSSLSLVRQYGEQNDKEKQVKHINRIKTSVNSLTDILNDMLSISKLEEGKITATIETFDIQELANEVLQEMQAIAKTGQTLDYVHKGSSQVTSDKKILKHILFNLCSNAIKFSPENSPIRFSTSVADGWITIKIRDEGMGISKEDQEHLFERFFRAQNATNVQGTGLGLNIVARYIELLDGTIDLESELEKGTTFTIQIPDNNE
ncbi:MAG TPA: PAS domain-containing sensor histidine kinase [Bacteroidia bacterium]|jgi:PAS domain S-box-containing protein